MEVFGLEIPLLTLLQVFTSAVVIVTFAFFTSRREQAADAAATTEMLLLVAFLIENSPKVSSIGQIAEASDKAAKDPDNEVGWLQGWLDDFRKSGSLPTLDAAKSSSLVLDIAVLLVAPLSTPFMLLTLLGEAWQLRAYRIRHTELRRNYMSKAILLLAGNVAYLASGVAFLTQSQMIVGGVLTGFGAFGLVMSLVLGGVLVWWQLSWKGYWTESLVHVIADATRRNDHDLFNRAFSMRAEVERQPDVPLPGGFGFYVVVFSVVQGALLWLSEFVDLT